MPIIAQNTYRAGISRVSNDLHLELCFILLLYAVSNKNFFWSSLSFSYSVSYKMNSLFFGPPLLFVYFTYLSFPKLILHFMLMGLFQILIALPFLYKSTISYVTLAFNFGRDFEHRVNMAWGFLGDSFRHSKLFYNSLLVLTILFLSFCFYFFYLLYYKNRDSNCTKTNKFKFTDEKELIINTFIIPNFICYTFSRGVHIQFILWINFSLPYLFTTASSLPWYFGLPIYLLFDWCHSWVPNAIHLYNFKPLLHLISPSNITSIPSFITNNIFTQLKSISFSEALSISKSQHVFNIVGGYYTVILILK